MAGDVIKGSGSSYFPLNSKLKRQTQIVYPDNKEQLRRSSEYVISVRVATDLSAAKDLCFKRIDLRPSSPQNDK